MHRRTIAAALTGLVAAASAVGGASSAQAADDDARIPAKYLNQTLDWVDCTTDGSVQCALMKAPLDWNHAATSPSIDIAISKSLPVGSTGRRLVMGNPGGPGAPGLAMAPLLAAQTGARDHLAVGFDVRGTGSSANLSCAGAPTYPWDARDMRQTTYDKVAAVAKAQQAWCRTGSGALLDFVTTDQTVKDMNLIRAVLRYPVTDYVGYSGGTWLGAYYQKYFPTRVGRFVLDSNADFTKPWNVTFGAQPQSFQRRFEKDFEPWAAKYDSTFHLGATASGVNGFYEKLRRDLVRKPLVITDGVNTVTVDGNAFDTAIISTLYSKITFPLLGVFLRTVRDQWDAARADGRGTLSHELTALVAKASRVDGANRPLSADAYSSTFTAITCNDWSWPGKQPFADARTRQLASAYPLAGSSFNRNACFYWHRPPVSLKVPDAAGIGTTLMVQSEHDPATNASLALDAHAHYPGSILIYVKKEGDHGIYASGNKCVDDLVNRFLATGVAPDGDKTCFGLPLPDPTHRGETVSIQEQLDTWSARIHF